MANALSVVEALGILENYSKLSSNRHFSYVNNEDFPVYTDIKQFDASNYSLNNITIFHIICGISNLIVKDIKPCKHAIPLNKDTNVI